MIEKLLLKQAQTLFNQIPITRHWNAKHGGVYTVLQKGEKPNPYLYKVGPSKDKKGNLVPLIVDQKGRKLALINPAIMTRELAFETKKHSNMSFHLTSLNLINPANQADEFDECSSHSGRRTLITKVINAGVSINKVKEIY